MRSRRDRSTSEPARQTALWARQEPAPPRAGAGEAGAGRGSRQLFKICWNMLETVAASQRGHMLMAVCIRKHCEEKRRCSAAQFSHLNLM